MARILTCLTTDETEVECIGDRKPQWRRNSTSTSASPLNRINTHQIIIFINVNLRLSTVQSSIKTP
ncbi:MAG TPA: hypothetical protein V6D14_29785 [Coleofasciculaceae cyanobacterium]